MRVRFTKPMFLFKQSTKTTSEGAKYAVYGDAVSFTGNSYPVNDAGGFGEYGKIDKHVRKLLTNSGLSFQKGDGVSLDDRDKPEYRIVEINWYSRHLEMVLEEL